MDINFMNSPIMSSSGWLCLSGLCLKHQPFNDVLAQLCCGKGCCDRMWCQYSAFSILSLPLAVWQHFLSKWACSSRGAALFFIPEASANGWSCRSWVHTFQESLTLRFWWQEGNWWLWVCSELLQGQGAGLELPFHLSVWPEQGAGFSFVIHSWVFNSSTISH